MISRCFLEYWNALTGSCSLGMFWCSSQHAIGGHAEMMPAQRIIALCFAETPLVCVVL